MEENIILKLHSASINEQSLKELNVCSLLPLLSLMVIGMLRYKMQLIIMNLLQMILLIQYINIRIFDKNQLRR